jgi:hypothetical protein
MLLADASSLPSHPQYVFSQGGYPIGSPEPDRSYWAVHLKDPDVWRCEMDTVTDLRIGGQRNLDWTLDLASTGDWKRITELWMICPPTAISPAGNTARLPITVPGTAFQLKVGFLDSNIGQSLKRQVAQMIGRVVNEETGECEVWCYDYGAQALIVHELDGVTVPQEGNHMLKQKAYGPWKTNVYNVGTWRPNIPGMPSVAPIGRLSFEVVGLHFGDSK